MPDQRPSPPRVTRREFLTTAIVGATGVLASCDVLDLTSPKASGSARLSARPGVPSSAGPLGLRTLGLGNSLADGVVYVPAFYSAASPAPFVLLLHGAGGTGASFITGFVPEADATGQILLAVDSRQMTWDGVGNGKFGPDIEFLDLALRDTFAKYAINATRMAVAGFSDGATMSLALGLANGDVFPRAIAWSPGGLIGREHRGAPEFFVSHGALDPVISVRATREDTVPALQKDGYRVTYREFNGGHTIPGDLRHESMLWAAR
jgi:phospholipase/carboxylesterase